MASPTPSQLNSLLSTMASTLHYYYFLLSSLLFFLSLSSAQQSFRPKAIVLPVTKDSSTRQYVARINQRTPLVPVSIVVDLGGRFFWVNCDRSYESSSYRPARCRSAQCSLAGANGCGDCFSPPRPGCNNNTCGVSPFNPFINTASFGEVAEDVVSVQSTDGRNPGRRVTVPRFIFSCAPTLLLRGLAAGATGVAGLGRTRVALPSQFASAFSFDRKFALCLSDSTGSNDGVIFFGDGPYTLLPGVDASKLLTFTPLLTNPASSDSAEYFIGVRSIRIDGEAVPLNASLLSINRDGGGGTRISTADPFTVMETSIFRAVTGAFIRRAASRNITRAAAVAPFGACFNANSIVGTRGGASVPTVELVLQSERVVWRIFGANSMVQVSDDVLCLAFVDGGSKPRSSIVIGTHQFQDNLLQFDLAASRLGFTSTLFFSQTTCSNFNFTSNLN